MNRIPPQKGEVEPYRGFARCILAIFQKYAICSRSGKQKPTRNGKIPRSRTMAQVGVPTLIPQRNLREAPFLTSCSRVQKFRPPQSPDFTRLRKRQRYTIRQVTSAGARNHAASQRDRGTKRLSRAPPLQREVLRAEETCILRFRPARSKRAEPLVTRNTSIPTRSLLIQFQRSQASAHIHNMSTLREFPPTR